VRFAHLAYKDGPIYFLKHEIPIMASAWSLANGRQLTTRPEYHSISPETRAPMNKSETELQALAILAEDRRELAKYKVIIPNRVYETMVESRMLDGINADQAKATCRRFRDILQTYDFMNFTRIATLKGYVAQGSYPQFAREYLDPVVKANPEIFEDLRVIMPPIVRQKAPFPILVVKRDNAMKALELLNVHPGAYYSS